jgi:hypothetical protein
MLPIKSDRGSQLLVCLSLQVICQLHCSTLPAASVQHCPGAHIHACRINCISICGSRCCLQRALQLGHMLLLLLQVLLIKGPAASK